MTGPRTTPPDRSAGDCILWWGAIDKTSGYGTFGRGKKAHRRVYEECLGAIPDGVILHHTCRTKACVNPAHLEPTTRRDHADSAPALLRAMTHCQTGHKFTPENTFRERTGRRRCRTCRKTYLHNYRSERKLDRVPS